MEDGGWGKDNAFLLYFRFEGCGVAFYRRIGFDAMLSTAHNTLGEQEQHVIACRTIFYIFH